MRWTEGVQIKERRRKEREKERSVKRWEKDKEKERKGVIEPVKREHALCTRCS